MRATARLLGAFGVAAAAACAAPGAGGPVDGERVYLARCSLCHPPWAPDHVTPGEWPYYVGKYAARAGLTRDERDAVLAYLVREAGRR